MFVYSSRSHSSIKPSIHLDNNHVVLYGTADEAAGINLCGVFFLDCSESVKIKSITIQLLGKSRVVWTTGTGMEMRHHKEEKTILQLEYVLLPLRNVHYLSAGVHRWNFEFPLAGHLPESVTTESGYVAYQLKAVVERTALATNIVAKRDVCVVRTLSPSSPAWNQTMVIDNTWAGKMAYNISIPCIVYKMGAVIPVTFDLVSIAPCISVHSVSCVLEECVTLSTDASITQERVLFEHTEKRFEKASHWKRTVMFTIPRQNVLADTLSSALIDIKHKLQFIVTLANGDGYFSRITAATFIIISPVTLEDVVNELPTYHDVHKTLLCNDTHLTTSNNSSISLAADGASQTPSISSRSSMTSASESEYLLNPMLPQACVSCHALGIQLRHFQSYSDSPPSYESGEFTLLKY